MSPSISTFRELKVWQASVDLAVRIYNLVRGFPRGDQYRVGDQLARAVISVASNIAEGHGRRRPAEYVHFIDIANGSLCEVVTQLEVCRRIGLVDDEANNKVAEALDSIGRMLTGLRRSILRER